MLHVNAGVTLDDLLGSARKAAVPVVEPTRPIARSPAPKEKAPDTSAATSSDWFMQLGGLSPAAKQQEGDTSPPQQSAMMYEPDETSPPSKKIRRQQAAAKPAKPEPGQPPAPGGKRGRKKVDRVTVADNLMSALRAANENT